MFPDEQDGDRVTPNEGARGGARAAVDDFSQVAPVETVTSSDGRGWRGVRVLRFRHTSGEVEVSPFTAHVVIVHLGPPVDVGESVNGGRAIGVLIRDPFRFSKHFLQAIRRIGVRED